MLYIHCNQLMLHVQVVDRNGQDEIFIRSQDQEISDFADVLSDKPFKSVSIFFSQLTSEQGNITWSSQSTLRTSQLIFRKCFGIQLCTKHY